jgi:hypothetical protein
MMVGVKFDLVYGVTSSKVFSRFLSRGLRTSTSEDLTAKAPDAA